MNIIYALLLTALCLTGCAQDSPKKTAEPAAEKQIPAPLIPAFNGNNAFQYLTAQTNFGPRNPGSAGHRNCQNYLYSELQKYAEAVNLQPFTIQGYEKETFKLNNIIASFNLRSTSRVLLVAHWDTRPWADQEPDHKHSDKPILGANDGASGVAVLLEIARCLKSSQPSVGVDILLTDGEDYGKEGDKNGYLHGARYFAKNLPPGFSPMFGILIDMIGDKELEIMKERYSLTFAPDVIDMVWGKAKELGVHQFSDKLQGYVTDDHLPLNNVGIKTIDLIDFDYPDTSNQYWHTHRDTPDKCSPESLEAVGKVLMAVIYDPNLK